MIFHNMRYSEPFFKHIYVQKAPHQRTRCKGTNDTRENKNTNIEKVFVDLSLYLLELKQEQMLVEY